MEDVKRYFKEGDEVAHKENIELKMEVTRIVRLHKKEEGKHYTIGIECGWWNDNRFEREKFHTTKLVPWNVAEKGYVAVVSYINSVNKIKN